MPSRLRSDLIRARPPVTSGIAARDLTGVNLAGRGDREHGPARQVSLPFFQTLGLQPLLGCTFRPEEDRLGGAPAVLISHGFWSRRFPGDPHPFGEPPTLGAGLATFRAATCWPHAGCQYHPTSPPTS
jgi:hypothetical protein